MESIHNNTRIFIPKISDVHNLDSIILDLQNKLKTLDQIDHQDKGPMDISELD